MKVDGQCHCGAIAYEADVQPGTVMLCHCADCQRQSGSAFRANIPTPVDSFRLLRGALQKYVKTADSGAQRVHTFCGNCGSPVFSCAAQHAQTYSLRVGGLNQRHALGPPSRQIWNSRRFTWLPPFEGVPACDTRP